MSPAVVAALSVAVFVFGTWSMPLTDPDEGRYAEIAREMAVSGDWLVPKLFDIPYLEKPPLLYWSTAAVFRLFGASDFTARLPPALAAAIGVLAVGAFASRHLSPRAGWLSSLTLALSGLYFVLGRTLVSDTMFAVTITVALSSFLAIREGRLGSRGGGVLFWVALGAATMTKGPAALVICGVVILVNAAVERSWRPLFKPGLWVSSPLFLALALPWFALIQVKYPEYLSFYLWKEHLHRAAGSEHAEPFYWFVPWLLIGFFPWTPLAIAALPGWRKARREDSPEGRICRFLLIWAAAVFVLFSLAAGKLATYILPMFPPLAILFGRYLDRLLSREVEEKAAAWSFLATGAFFLLALGALIVAAFVLHTALGLVSWSLVAVPLLAGGVGTIAWRESRPRRALAVLTFSTVALYVGLATVAPALSESFTARPFIRRLEQEMRPADDYALFGAYFPSAAFYLHRPPYLVGVRPELRFGKELLGDSPTIVADLPALHSRTRDRRLYCLTDTREKREGELRAALGEVDLVGKNYLARLWLRPPSSGPSPAQALTQGKNR